MLYVSVNKQLVNFQNFLGVLTWLPGKGLNAFSHLKYLPVQRTPFSWAVYSRDLRAERAWPTVCLEIIQKKVEHIPRVVSLYVIHWGGAFGWGTSLQAGRSRFWWGHWHNPSGRAMALGSTQLPTEISTRDICWGEGSRCVGLTTLPTSGADCPEILYKRLTL